MCKPAVPTIGGKNGAVQIMNAAVKRLQILPVLVRPIWVTVCFPEQWDLHFSGVRFHHPRSKGTLTAPTQGSHGQTCCVPGCDNNTVKSQGLSWHKCPNDPALKKIWQKHINQKSTQRKSCLWTPKLSHRICGVHFNKTGRKGYEDKVPRFVLTKTYPDGHSNNPQKRCVCCTSKNS